MYMYVHNTLKTEFIMAQFQFNALRDCLHETKESGI